MLFRSLLLAAASMASTTNALYFYLEYMGTVDNRGWNYSRPDSNRERADYTVTFLVSAPANAYEQGGSDVSACDLSWNGTAPTCYTPCGDASYWARITPGSFDSFSCFKLDIWQAYIAEIGAHNTATVNVFQDANGGYQCGSDGCSTNYDVGFNVTLTQNYGLSEPDASAGGACYYP